MDLKTLTSAIMEIAEEKGITQEKVKEIIEIALSSAYKKEYGAKGEKYEVNFNLKTGEMNFYRIKQVVTEEQILSKEEAEEIKKSGDETPENKIHFNSERHILLEEAKKLNPQITANEFLKIPAETKEEFGRIAAQTAKQVILQKIKKAEKEVVLKDYQEKQGELISGIVQRVEPTAVFFDIGKISGILPKTEQIPGEFYQTGKRLKLYLLKIEEEQKNPLIFVSRAYPKLVSKLFELEVPEISTGQVVIKSIAREPGSRTKIAVHATEKDIDPIGALVGQRGSRIMTVINELGGEKIDVIEWSEKSEKYVVNSLGPAKILEVKILPHNKAEALVNADQLSLAIGKDGQNVRLVAKLTGWKIDIKPVVETKKED
ncbi:transcription termination factor NusA [Patescibacteria group bacterium]|nr:transcription termination factor NusA [Patescibacteria group bacterium]